MRVDVDLPERSPARAAPLLTETRECCVYFVRPSPRAKWLRAPSCEVPFLFIRVGPDAGIIIRSGGAGLITTQPRRLALLNDTFVVVGYASHEAELSFRDPNPKWYHNQEV